MALPAALKGPWCPFTITGTQMPPNLLLLCKILAVAVLATGHFRILPDPFLPFIPGLDALIDPSFFKRTLQTVVVVAAVALLFNRCPRAFALILGSCLLLAVVSSKAYYGNNKTFVGLALVLAGLSDFDRPPYLLRWLLAFTYFGAALNKLLLEDWQNGLFFAYWATKVRNPVYLAIVDVVPPLFAGAVMCWATIIGEFVIAIGVFFRRLVPLALWVNVLFQFGLLQFTGGTFTLFFYAMQAMVLAFVTWPKPEEYLLQMDGSWKDVIPIFRRLLFSPTFWLIGTAALGLLDLVPLPAGCAPIFRRLLATFGLLVGALGYPWKGWTFGRADHILNGNER
jgi:hypothetical protein